MPENPLPSPLTLDLLVGQVIVECNATKNLNPVYDVQLLAYPRLTGLKLGLPMNFGETRVSDDARRVVNSF